MSLDDRKRAWSRFDPRFVLPLLLAPFLLWPALVNGGPFFFPDTPAYIRGVDALVLRMTGSQSVWTSAKSKALVQKAPAEAKPLVNATPARSGASKSDTERPPVLSGRSVYYGALLYLGVVVGTLWLPIFIQALCATTAIVFAMRHAISPDRRSVFVAMCCLVTAILAVTPLPFFVCMLMPDVFVGLAIVAAAILIAAWHRCSRGERVGWAALATYATLCHASVTLILLGTAVAAAALTAITWIARSRRSRNWAAIGLVGAAAIMGLIGELAFSTAVEQMSGQPPIRPPFITARITADGVGTEYLNRHCDRQTWHLCRYRARLPLHSDSFLWSPNQRDGVFTASSASDQRALSAEQSHFALAVAQEYPLRLASTLLAASVDQFESAGLPEFVYEKQGNAGFEKSLPPTVMAHVRTTAAYRLTTPIAPFAALVWPLTFLSLTVLLYAAIRKREGQLVAIGGYAVTGWIINVLVCGMLSTPHDRYQARVIWVLPLTAFMVAVAMWARRRSSADTAPTDNVSLQPSAS